MTRPGWLVRAALVSFGALFLPLAVWFLWKGYWVQAATLGVISVLFLKAGVSRREDSWVCLIDDLGTRVGNRKDI